MKIYNISGAICYFMDANGLKHIDQPAKVMLENLDKMLLGIAQEREYYLKQMEQENYCPNCGHYVHK